MEVWTGIKKYATLNDAGHKKLLAIPLLWLEYLKVGIIGDLLI